MTNKVQKIREEVEKLKLCTMDEHMKFYSDAAEAEYNALCEVEKIIDSLQEELVSKVWHYQKNEPVNEIADKSRPIIVVYGSNSLNATGKFRCYEDNSDAIWLSNSYEKWAFVEDLINLSHSVTKVNWQEKPVSDDLEEAANFYANTHTEWFDADNNPHVLSAFKAGANWQKEQMMAKAIDGTARPDDNEIWCNLTSNNLKDGDKVKVIVIKED